MGKPTKKVNNGKAGEIARAISKHLQQRKKREEREERSPTPGEELEEVREEVEDQDEIDSDPEMDYDNAEIQDPNAPADTVVPAPENATGEHPGGSFESFRDTMARLLAPSYAHMVGPNRDGMYFLHYTNAFHGHIVKQVNYDKWNTQLFNYMMDSKSSLTRPQYDVLGNLLPNMAIERGHLESRPDGLYRIKKRANGNTAYKLPKQPGKQYVYRRSGALQKTNEASLDKPKSAPEEDTEEVSETEEDLPSTSSGIVSTISTNMMSPDDDQPCSSKNMHRATSSKKNAANKRSSMLPTEKLMPVSFVEMFLDCTPLTCMAIEADPCEGEGDERNEEIRRTFAAWRTQYHQLRIVVPGATEFATFTTYLGDLKIEGNYALHTLSMHYRHIEQGSSEPSIEHNWKMFRLGDIVWARWRKNEVWPASIINFVLKDDQPPQVKVQWINDTTNSVIPYHMVDWFDLAYHLRFDPKKSDPRYIKAVCQAIVTKGYIGYWEEFLSPAMFDVMIHNKDMRPLLIHLPPSSESVLLGMLEEKYNPLTNQYVANMVTRPETTTQPKKKKGKRSTVLKEPGTQNLAQQGEDQLECVVMYRYLREKGHAPHESAKVGKLAKELIFNYTTSSHLLGLPLFEDKDNLNNNTPRPPKKNIREDPQDVANRVKFNHDEAEEPERVPAPPNAEENKEYLPRSEFDTLMDVRRQCAHVLANLSMGHDYMKAPRQRKGAAALQ